MARIGSYPIDAVIQDKDAWIGTQNTNRVTRQFTALGVAEYIDTKNVGLVFVGATNLLDGAKGLVPAPVAGQEGMYLKGNLGGGWTTIPVYTLDVPTGTTNVNLINTDGAGGIINSFITLTGGTYLTSVHTSGSQITFNHDLTTRTDTASASSPAAGGTVNLVSSVTSNATGHIEAVNIETVTWPADSDTTYTIDVPNATTSINLAGSDGTNDPIAFTTVAGNNGMTISRTDANTLNFNSKWQINNVNQDGYVPKGTANANKFWATDGNGNPGWTFQPSQDQTLTSTGTTNASTGIVLSQNGGTVIVKGDGSTISASSDNTTNVITLEAINRVNTTYTLPVAAGAANTAVINLTDNSAIVSSVTFNGTANKIAISETVGNNGDITIGMPDDVTVTGELTVSGTGQSSFGGQITIPQTPSADTDAASKKYVDDLVAGGLTFRGTFNAATGEILSGVSSGSYLYNCPGGAGTRIAVAVGDYYIVATAGGSFYCSGATLDIGDSIIATAAAAADASVVTGWSVVQSDEGVASFTNANGTFVSAGTVNSNATGAVTMGTIDLSATGTKDGTTFLRGDNTWAVPAYVSYSAMTTSTLGLGKIKYDFGSTPAAESQSTVTARTYGVTKNASDQLVVNVPWLNSSDVNSVTASGATTALSGLSSTPNTGAVVIGLDINGRASLGSPAGDDELMIYDTSTAKNVKVLVSDLASYAGSAATNQVTYWTSANEIGGATGFTFAGGANGAVAMGGALTVAGDVSSSGTSKSLKYWRRLWTDANNDWGLNNNAGSAVISVSGMGTPSSSSTTFAGSVEIRSGNKLILQRPDNGVATEISTDSTGAMILNSINDEGFFFNNNGTNAFKLDPINATFAGEITSGDDINVVNGKLTVNNTSAEVRIKSDSDTGESFINFSDPSDNNVGQIYYGHGTNKMSIRVNDATRLAIDSGGDIEVEGGDLFLNSGTNYNDKGVVYISNERTAIISDIVNATANGDTSLDFQTRSGGATASAIFIDEFRNSTFSGQVIASSSSSGDYVRMYGASGTGRWDIYGNGENLRISENSSGGGYVDIDTMLNVDAGLTVTGNSTFAGNIIIYNASNAPFIDFVESGATTDSKARITMDQVDTDNGTLLFATEGSGTLATRMQINASGKVGINETNDARTQLEVKATTSSRNTVTRILTLNANGDAIQPYEPFGTGIIFEGFDYAGGGGTSTSRDYAYIDARIETSGSTPVDFTSRLVFATNSGGSSTTLPTNKLVIKGSGQMVNTMDLSGFTTNLLLSNLNDTDGDTAGIGFSMLDNGTYVKSGIYFKRTTTQGRGDLLFLNNNEVNGNNATLSDAKMTISSDGKIGFNTTTFAPTTSTQIKLGDMGSGVVGEVYDANVVDGASRFIMCSDGNTGQVPIISMRHYSAAYGIDLWMGYTSPWNTYIDNRHPSSGFVFRNNTNTDGSENVLMSINGSGDVESPITLGFKLNAPASNFTYPSYGFVGHTGRGMTMANSNELNVVMGGASRHKMMSGRNTAYVADGLFGTNATPDIINSASGGGFYLGYQDNGSGLYAPAYAFLTTSTDGLGNTSSQEVIKLKNDSSGQINWTVSNLGAVVARGSITSNGSPSDRKLKENIKPIDSALTTINKLQGVSFDWKEDASILDEKEDYGFIAQDVQKVLPEIIKEDEVGTLSMRYNSVIPILVESVKELEKVVKDLKKEIIELKNK